MADLTEVIRLDPKSVEAYDRRKRLYRYPEEDRDKARADLDSIIAILGERLRNDAASIETYRERARRYMEKAGLDYDELRERDRKAAYADPRAASNSHGNLDKAMADLTEAIRLDPKSIEAYEQRASIHSDWKVKDFDRAIADYSEILRIAPTSIEIYRKRSRTYMQKAKRDFDELRERDRKAAYADRRAAYNSHGNLDKAIADLTEAIRLDPKSIEAYEQRASIYGDTVQDRDKARADLDSIIAILGERIRIAPASIETYRQRSRTYMEKAAMDFDELRDRDSKAAYADPRAASNSHGDVDRAIADVTEAIRLDPKSVETYKQRASIHSDWKVKDFDQAVADYIAIIRLDPTNEHAYTARGSAYSDMCDYRAAIANYEEASRVVPDASWAERIESATKSRRDEGIGVGDTVAAICRTPIMDGPTTLGTMDSGSHQIAKKVSTDRLWVAVDLQKDGKKQKGWIQKRLLCSESQLENLKLYAEKHSWVGADQGYQLNTRPLPVRLPDLDVVVASTDFSAYLGIERKSDGVWSIGGGTGLSDEGQTQSRDRFDKRLKAILSPYCSSSFGKESEWRLVSVLGTSASCGGDSASLNSIGYFFNTRRKALVSVIEFSGKTSEANLNTALDVSADECASRIIELLDNQASN